MKSINIHLYYSYFLNMPKKRINPQQSEPYTQHQNLFIEIIRQFPTNGTDDEKNRYDLNNAKTLLFDIFDNKIPDDDLTKHIIYACLSEPKNLERMKTYTYKRIKTTLDNLKNISLEQINQNLTYEDKQKIIDDVIFATNLKNYLHAPPHMELTIGKTKTQTIITQLGMPQYFENNHELWEKYLSGKQIISLDLFKNPKIILDTEYKNMNDVFNELLTNKIDLKIY